MTVFTPSHAHWMLNRNRNKKTIGLTCKKHLVSWKQHQTPRCLRLAPTSSACLDAMEQVASVATIVAAGKWYSPEGWKAVYEMCRSIVTLKRMNWNLHHRSAALMPLEIRYDSKGIHKAINANALISSHRQGNGISWHTIDTRNARASNTTAEQSANQLFWYGHLCPYYEYTVSSFIRVRKEFTTA